MSERLIDAGGYSVRIAPGLRQQFARLVAEAAPAHRYAVISDDNVAALYADELVRELGATLHVIPSGEAHKTRDVWARVTDELLDAGCARDTTIVALGGGVVGDLAGFVAATFMRGVPVVQCPTTLLAMIDASIGGKTGVDTRAGKNLVGAFHAPAAVLIDIDVLSSLPAAHRRAGLAEAIKHGVIADAEYFASLDDAKVTLEVVARSVEIKAAVVAADSHEHGVRKTLNFGHTIGHAIEHASGYALLHGECVAIGMVLEARLAERIGVAIRGTAAEIERVVARASLPAECPADVSADQILDATRHDKKSRAGAVEYVLPERIGTMRWGIRVDDADVRAVLA